MLADELSIDASLVRVAFVLSLALSGGLTTAAYVLFWLLTPPGPAALAPFSRFTRWLDRLFSSRGPTQQQPTGR
jgi:hypothetical protein